MFTGIIRHVGLAQWIDFKKFLVVVHSGDVSAAQGDSVAINGVCLTVVEVGDNTLVFQVSEHTRAATSFRTLDKGDNMVVHIEPSAVIGERNGGHDVTGHVTAAMEVASIDATSDIEWRIRVPLPKHHHVTVRDAVALDGVSLTVANLVDDVAEFVVIGETLDATHFRQLQPGSVVNVECSLEFTHGAADRTWMQRALELAERVPAKVLGLDPHVGCVIVGAGGVVAEGAHTEEFGEHAEIAALAALADDVDPAHLTLYTTLEPCCPETLNSEWAEQLSRAAPIRTGGCVEKILAAGIPRVVVGILDADERVSGVAYLRERGVDVLVMHDARVADSLRAYTYHRRSGGYPLVTAKVALSLDGCIGYADGTSQWLTGDAARQHARDHVVGRASVVVFGAGTVWHDAVLDTQFADDEMHVVVVVDDAIYGDGLRDAYTSRLAALKARRPKLFARANTTVLTKFAWPAFIKNLGKRNVHVVIEGGGATHAAALAADVVDRLLIYRAPAIIGAHGRRWLAALEYGQSMAGIGRFEHVGEPRTFADGTVLSHYTIRATGATKKRLVAALAALKRGDAVAIADASDREHEIDLVTTPQAFDNTLFRAKTTNIVCVAMPAEHARRLALPPMVAQNRDRFETPFTVSVDAVNLRDGSGVSAADRATTLLALHGADAGALVRPGHVFPLAAQRGLTRRRGGHTEASVSLLRVAGIDPPTAVIAEMQNADGTMVRDARAVDEVLVTVDDLRRVEPPVLRDVELLAETKLFLDHGAAEWRLQVYSASAANNDAAAHHKVLIYGDLADRRTASVLVRIHSECYTGDALGSAMCDCGPQLVEARKRIAERGCGLIVVVAGHEGRGIGLVDKVRAYAHQRETGTDTFGANEALGHTADPRRYNDAAKILARLVGDAPLELLSQNPLKAGATDPARTTLVDMTIHESEHSHRYLAAKAARFSLPPQPLQFTAAQLKRVSVVIVAARWRSELVSQLEAGVVDELRALGITAITTHHVPGALELAYPAAKYMRNGTAQVVIVLGLLMRGATHHFDLVFEQLTTALATVSVERNVAPLINGVVACTKLEHARERCARNGVLAKSLAQGAVEVAMGAGAAPKPPAE